MNGRWLAVNGVGAVVAITPIVAVGGALLVAAVICIGIIVILAFRHRSPVDPPLENQVLGDWFEPDDAAAANGGVPAASAVPNGGIAVAANGAANGDAAASAEIWPTTVTASALAEPALHAAEASPAAARVAFPAAPPTEQAPASSPAPAPMRWEPALVPAGEPDAGRFGVDRPAEEPGPDFEPAPEGGEEFDYGSLERDLGFTERTGGALAIGIASIVLVVLIGLWLVASAHHGTGTPVHIVHSPQVGPPGPQGSPGP